jgi:hypothetical protein
MITWQHAAGKCLPYLKLSSILMEPCRINYHVTKATQQPHLLPLELVGKYESEFVLCLILIGVLFK